jgi:ferredoxin/menaquinone-dependent protoporphyrinogen IX oxidase
MKFNSAGLIYFSPTGTTREVTKAIARGIEADAITAHDLTPPVTSKAQVVISGNDLAIIGAPVYGGRIPPDARKRLEQINGNGAAAVVLVMYGNREYEDALLELKDIAIKADFRPVAGGAFIGEHSYHTDDRPIAAGRPDTQDLQKAVAFGQTIRQKMSAIKGLDEMPPLTVPGNFPYKKRGQAPLASPVTHEAICAKCGECAGVCPKAVITVGDTVMTEAAGCIHCTACVKICPTGARTWEDSRIKNIAEWLSTNYYERKEPELYFC